MEKSPYSMFNSSVGKKPLFFYNIKSTGKPVNSKLVILFVSISVENSVIHTWRHNFKINENETGSGSDHTKKTWILVAIYWEKKHPDSVRSALALFITKNNHAKFYCVLILVKNLGACEIIKQRRLCVYFMFITKNLSEK